MLSPKMLELYRRMSPGERLSLTFQMMREAIPYLLDGPREIVDRRFQVLHRQNEARNKNMLQAIARTLNTR